LGGKSAKRPRTAAQQGLLQILHDFCDQTDTLCIDRLFPDLVKGLLVNKAEGYQIAHRHGKPMR
jgi:hypothetical protein